MVHWSQLGYQGKVSVGDQRWSLVLQTPHLFRCERRHLVTEEVTTSLSRKQHGQYKGGQRAQMGQAGQRKTLQLSPLTMDTSGVCSVNTLSADPGYWAWTRSARVLVTEHRCQGSRRKSNMKDNFH